MSKCIYLEYEIDSTGKREYYCPKRNEEVDPIANCKFCKHYRDGFENKKEATTASECRSNYEEGYIRGFADGYERALRNTPTFPISTSPAHIVPDQLQGWRLEENDN